MLALMYGMMPRVKTAQFSRRAAAEQVEEADHGVVLLGEHVVEIPREDFRVDAWTGNGRTEAHNDNDAEREDDALAQLGNLKAIGKCG